VRAVRVVSTLDEEFESPKLEAWLVEIALAAVVRAASTLDDEMEKEFELALRVPRAASTLVDELLRARLEV
jgi:hypothetical protein